MSTIVNLRTVWLASVTDPTDVRAFRFMSSLTESVSQTTRIQDTASGGRRVIRTAGRDGLWTITLPACDADQMAWLNAHLGETLCARDDRGNKIFGLYSSVKEEMKSLRNEGDTSLDFDEVTYSEEV